VIGYDWSNAKYKLHSICILFCRKQKNHSEKFHSLILSFLTVSFYFRKYSWNVADQPCFWRTNNLYRSNIAWQTTDICRSSPKKTLQHLLSLQKDHLDISQHFKNNVPWMKATKVEQNVLAKIYVSLLRRKNALFINTRNSCQLWSMAENAASGPRTPCFTWIELNWFIIVFKYEGQQSIKTRV